MANQSKKADLLKSSWRIATILLVLLLVLYPQKIVQAAAASTCQCTAYIQHRFGITGGGPYAKDYGPFLKTKGFKQLSSPEVGAVAVMQPSFGWGVSTVAGHVSVITAVANLGKYWQITTIGANQSSAHMTQDGCTNVGYVTWPKYPKSWGANRISYWLPPKK